MVVLCASLGIVCLFDYTRGKIPNPFPVLLMLVGMVRSFYNGGAAGLGFCFLTMAGTLLLLYPIFRIGGLGAGDVKLLSVCSGYFSVSQIFWFLFWSMLISAFFSVIPLFREHNLRERFQYFVEYCTAVVRSGKWQLYLPCKDGERLKGVCMSGPILCSVLLCLGGFY